jgi:hypothetical protein
MEEWGMLKGGLAAVALIVALLAVAGCGGGSSDDNAHINKESGSTNDLIPDDREGTPPPPVKSTDLRKLADEAGCFLLLNLKPEEGKELPPGAPAPEYETDPPVSGSFVEPPYQQADGAYMNLPEKINQVGALNHGRMTIQYAPDLAEESQLLIKGLYDTMYGATLLFPNDEMNYAVAATTWKNFLGCTSWDPDVTLDAIRAFGKKTWGKYGNESVDSFPFEGPTPADPENSE